MDCKLTAVEANELVLAYVLRFGGPSVDVEVVRAEKDLQKHVTCLIRTLQDWDRGTRFGIFGFDGVKRLPTLVRTLSEWFPKVKKHRPLTHEHIVRNLRESVEFYAKALGFDRRNEWTDKRGRRCAFLRSPLGGVTFREEPDHILFGELVRSHPVEMNWSTQLKDRGLIESMYKNAVESGICVERVRRAPGSGFSVVEPNGWTVWVLPQS